MQVNNEKYQHIGRALTVRLSGRERETDPPGEGSLELEVEADRRKLGKFNCFMSTEYAQMFYAKKIDANQSFKVEFWLAGDYTVVTRLENKVKSAEWIEYPEFMSNYYLVKGEVVEIKEHPTMRDSNLAILDCGMYVFARIIKTAPLKVGDYIQLRGRLDAHIVGKVN